jgi:hypothetical protein
MKYKNIFVTYAAGFFGYTLVPEFLSSVIISRFATAFGISLRLRLDLLINDLTYQTLKTSNLVVNDYSF